MAEIRRELGGKASGVIKGHPHWIASKCSRTALKKPLFSRWRDSSCDFAEEGEFPRKETVEENMERFQLLSLSALIFGASAIGAEVQSASQQPDQVFGKVPLAFEANAGQTDPHVKYFARGNGYTAFLTANETVLALTKRVPGLKTETLNEKMGASPERGQQTTFSATVRMRLVGANPNVLITPVGPMPSRITYLTGRADAPPVRPLVYQKVEYHDVWPGVSMVYYGNQRQLEYDFAVAPAALPSAIRLSFEGAKDLKLDAQGNLVLTTEIGELRQPAPLMYQQLNGHRVVVQGSYVVLEGRQVGFRVGSYDATRPLIIDPTLSFGVTWGGSGHDYAEAVVVNPRTGEIYVAGYTSSPDFPTSNSVPLNGSSDAFVSKVSADGTTLLFSTYIGGSFDDEARAIALDASGNVYITGQTQSNNFPQPSAQYRCSQLATTSGQVPCGPTPSQTPAKFFVVKLDANGKVLAANKFGGSYDDYGNAIAVDNQGRIYVAGRTYSSDFPTLPYPSHLQGQSDAFLAAFVTDQNGGLSMA
ncbi:MAG TPA: SBBP repeat-containing protein, partial [Gemmataceae bacterium]|nr:SBBP repeat-containing protein [Gemmataceae bacterium]